jgi:hypothetical protein
MPRSPSREIWKLPPGVSFGSERTVTEGPGLDLTKPGYVAIDMLPNWLSSFPIWLIVFIALYALATLYAAIRFREVRKFLAGAFFVSAGILWYLWMTGVSIPVVMPYVGTISIETPEISGQRAIVHFVLFLLCFYFGFISKPK